VRERLAPDEAYAVLRDAVDAAVAGDASLLEHIQEMAQWALFPIGHDHHRERWEAVCHQLDRCIIAFPASEEARRETAENAAKMLSQSTASRVPEQVQALCGSKEAR
jgi:hypothetical protein